MTTARTAEKWRVRVREWESSGRTIAEFVRGREFSASALRSWVRQLSADTPAPEVTLLPVRRRSSTAPATTATGVVLEVGGVRIRVEYGFDRTLLLEVLSALGGA
jgi:hypothetical protein